MIKFYWKYIPESKRRKCLFKTSCSHYVYNKTKEYGLISGIKSLVFRMKNCNPNYIIMDVERHKILISASNVVFKEEEINHNIIN